MISTRPTLIMLCGAPGSGKTTYSRKSAFDNYVKLSTDSILVEAMMSDGLTYQESFQTNIVRAEHELVENLKAALQAGSNIVLDQMNLTVTGRRKKLLRVPSEVYNKIAVSFVEPEDLLLQRNKERLTGGYGMPEDILKSYISKYQEPTVREGFDEVWSKGELRF